jgi:predicted flap endonuclease-1-like 5' DNA nuclease
MAYPIAKIQGIGTDIAEILKQEGIRTTRGLLRSAKTPKQRFELAVKTGTVKAEVLDWVTAADRMRVKGIGADYSELLRIVGVRTVNELRFRNAEKLAEAMRNANAKRKLVRVRPSAKMVTRWIQYAKSLPTVIRY